VEVQAAVQRQRGGDGGGTGQPARPGLSARHGGKAQGGAPRLLDALRTLPYLAPQPSEANFVLCSVVGREAKMVKLALEQQGILVRYYNKPGLNNCIRISVGLPEQTNRLVEALRAIVARQA
jgi:histidinol-phosphate/aromatic aminotransferase/cobyric acid decarboxylase-like protein